MTEPARWSAAWRKHNVNLALQISCVLLMRFMSPLHAGGTAIHNRCICHASCLFITRRQGAKHYNGTMLSLGIIRHHLLPISTSCLLSLRSIVGATCRSRTCDPQLRRLLLYPTELTSLCYWAGRATASNRLISLLRIVVILSGHDSTKKSPALCGSFDTPVVVGRVGLEPTTKGL